MDVQYRAKGLCWAGLGSVGTSGGHCHARWELQCEVGSRGWGLGGAACEAYVPYNAAGQGWVAAAADAPGVIGPRGMSVAVGLTRMCACGCLGILTSGCGLLWVWVGIFVGVGVSVLAVMWGCKKRGVLVPQMCRVEAIREVAPAVGVLSEWYGVLSEWYSVLSEWYGFLSEWYGLLSDWGLWVNKPSACQ
jgi:hypothetical protein